MRAKHLHRLALLLAVCLILLSGCRRQTQNAQPSAVFALPEPEAVSEEMLLGEHQDGQLHEAVLFYIAADGTELTSIFRAVYIGEEDTLAEVILRELFNPPGSADLRPVVPGETQLLSFESANGIATVNLSIDAYSVQTEQELYLMHAAISATLMETGEFDGVNILIGGQSEYAYRLPAGVMSRRSEGVVTAIAQLQTESDRFLNSDGSARGTITRDALLYFPDRSDDLLVPEVRRITFEDENYARALLFALREGPGPTEDSLAPLPKDEDPLLSEPGISITEKGMRMLDLSFTAALSAYLDAAGLSEDRFAAAITMTMCSFIPELDGVRIAIDGRLLEEVQVNGAPLRLRDGLHTRARYAGRVGSVAQLYFTGPTGGLVEISRGATQACAASPLLTLKQLFAGPVGAEVASPALPEGVSEQDVLGISIKNGIARVNLSGNFYRQCQALDAREERNAVFSIVNTLCNFRQISGVRLCIEGNAANQLAQSIYLRSMLMYNPGILESSAADE